MQAITSYALDTANVQAYTSDMQRRTGYFPTTTTPGRTTIVERVRAQGERASVRDVVLAGGFRRLTVKEMFDGR